MMTSYIKDKLVLPSVISADLEHLTVALHHRQRHLPPQLELRLRPGGGESQADRQDRRDRPAALRRRQLL